MLNRRYTAYVMYLRKTHATGEDKSEDMSETRLKITVDNKDYEYTILREGIRVFTQTIFVNGFGSQKDEKQYGNGSNYRDVHLMKHEAHLIALRLIRSKSG